MRREGYEVQYDTMVAAVTERLPSARENADTVLAACVQAVSEIAGQEAVDMQAQLPKQLARVRTAGPTGPWSLDEFVSRVGALTGAQDMAQAREYAQAAFSVLAESLSAGQLRQLMQALPEDYGSLAPTVSGLAGNEETFLAEVRRQAKVDTVEEARLITQTVLAVLAESVSGGQAARLVDAIPEDLAAYLRSTESAAHTDTARFLDEILQRSSVTKAETVREPVSVVVTVLGQWAPREMADLLSQLPDPLAELAG